MEQTGVNERLLEKKGHKAGIFRNHEK